jgi:hypothetical protein
MEKRDTGCPFISAYLHSRIVEVLGGMHRWIRAINGRDICAKPQIGKKEPNPLFSVTISGNMP